MKKRLLVVLLAFSLMLSCLSVAIYANSAQTGIYNVSVSSALTNGNITLSKTKADMGDVVEVTIKPKKGYITKAGSTVYTYAKDGLVTKALANRVSEYAVGRKFYFTMPAENVTVYAEFVSTLENNFSFDMVASSVKSGDESFKAGSFDKMRFISRLYFESGVYNTDTGVITLKKDGETKQVAEIGTLYAKTETLGATNEISLENVGANGIEKSVAYTSESPLRDNFSDITLSYFDFAAEITVEDSQTDYTVKSYIKLDDNTVIYSSERTDFADNVAARLNLCNTDNTEVDETLTISSEVVNTSFEGFGAVMYPWTETCRKEGVNVTLATIQAKKEVRLMSEAGIRKVRLIVSNFPIDYYDFTNKQAKALSSDWYTDMWVDMLTTLKNYKIDVQLNLGWGTEFANSMQNKKITSVLGGGYSDLSFDEQVTAYGQLSAELVKYLLDNGCSNITSVTFLSEPGNGWQGSTWYEVTRKSPQLNFTPTIEAYDKCVKSVQTAFESKNITGLKFVYGNVSLLYDPTIITTTDEETTTYDWWNREEWNNSRFQKHTMTAGKNWIIEMLDKLTAKADAYSYHYYGKFNNAKVSNYTANQEALNAIVTDALSGTNLTPNDIYMDEVSVKYYGTSELSNDKSKESPYEATQLAEYLSTLMNGGYKGAYIWTFSDFASDNMYGLMPNAISAVKGNGVPYDRYYATTLITKYLNNCSTIYAGSQSNGCITVMGKDAQDNTTILVVNMNHVNKTVKVNLPEELGANFNRHIYNPSVNYRTIEGKIIGIDKQLKNVTNSFTDSIPAGGVAIYTTK